MKKLSLYINIALFLAIAVLYYLFFTSNKKAKEIDEYDISVSTKLPNLSFAYVNIDSLLESYDLFYDLKQQLINKQQASEAELNSKAKKFEEEYIDYQNKIQKGLITRANAKELEKQLSFEQEKLLKLKNDLGTELAEEEMVMNRRMIYEIMDYLKAYNKSSNYQFILSNSFGGALLYANDSLNITSVVVKGLNAKYNKEKKTKK